MEALAGGKPLSARARQIAKSREELLGLLSDLPDSDHELSFTDLVESKPARGAASAEAAEAPPTTQGGGRAAEQETKKTARAGKERRRSRRSDSRGSCGGGGDGVLLNFYVPGLLTRSMTAPRPGRGQAVPGVPTVAAAGKAIMEAPPAVGCWTALWGRGRDRRKPMKPPERRDLRVSA